jgi:hypothetical protein
LELVGTAFELVAKVIWCAAVAAGVGEGQCGAQCLLMNVKQQTMVRKDPIPATLSQAQFKIIDSSDRSKQSALLHCSGTI